MTIYGPDISSFQQGVNVAALADPFVLLKCTEGTYYADADYPGWLGQAKASRKLPVAYHFVKAEDGAEAQAAWLAAHIRDKSVPVMLDVETEGSSVPHLQMVLDVADQMKAHGLNVRLVYLPRWFWEQIGSPSLIPLTQRGIGIVSSAYPGRRGQNPATGYQGAGGDAGVGWAPYGGATPVLWQYTDAGVEQQSLDFNAFRGTIDQLAALLGGSLPGNGGTVSDNFTMSAGWAGDYPDVADALNRHIPVGTVVTPGLASGYAMVRSLVSAERDAAILAKLAEIEGKIAQPPTIDVGAVAAQIVAAISGHLSFNVDTQAVAVAVQAQLAQALGGHGVG